jgi:hypothetical protein
MEFVTNGPKFLALDCTGAQPTPRSGHVAVIDGQGVYLYVFGGYHEAKYVLFVHEMHAQLECAVNAIFGSFQHALPASPVDVLYQASD